MACGKMIVFDVELWAYAGGEGEELKGGDCFRALTAEFSPTYWLALVL